MIASMLRWIFAVLVFVLTLEASIRVEDYVRWGAPLLGTYSHDGLFVSDSIGWHPRPGASYQKWHIDRYGFRGPEFERVKPSDVIRVAVLGSSETFGQAESADMEFPRVLERELNARAEGRRFQVINAGVPGMSVARMPAYWERWVRSFDVDVTVIYPSPTFYLNDQPPRETTSPGIGQPASVEGVLHSRLRPAIRQALNRLIPNSVEGLLKRVLIRRHVNRHPPDWVWEEVPGERLDAFGRDLGHLIRTLQDSQVAVILGTHANPIAPPLDEQEQATLIGWRRFHPRARSNVILDFEKEANDLMATMGQELGAQVVPIDAIVPDSSQYFSDHTHFTDRGALLVGAAFAAAVANSAPVRGRPRTRGSETAR